MQHSDKLLKYQYLKHVIAMMIIAGKGQGKGLGAGIWYPGSYLFVSLLQTSSVKRQA
jgi:hypothetical protein